MFAIRQHIPIEVITHISDRKKLLSLTTTLVMVVLPGWSQLGFQAMDGFLNWTKRGGKSMKISRGQMNGILPLDKIPLM